MNAWILILIPLLENTISCQEVSFSPLMPNPPVLQPGNLSNLDVIQRLQMFFSEFNLLSDQIWMDLLIALCFIYYVAIAFSFFFCLSWMNLQKATELSYFLCHLTERFGVCTVLKSERRGFEAQCCFGALKLIWGDFYLQYCSWKKKKKSLEAKQPADPVILMATLRLARLTQTIAAVGWNPPALHFSVFHPFFFFINFKKKLACVCRVWPQSS